MITLKNDIINIIPLFIEQKELKIMEFIEIIIFEKLFILDIIIGITYICPIPFCPNT